MNKKILSRFDELNLEADIVSRTKFCTEEDDEYPEYAVNNQLFTEWYLKVKNLLNLCSTNENIYEKELIEAEKYLNFYTTNVDVFQKIESIFLAAKDDYENGYLTSIRTLITAEVFDNELEQAQELLNSKYHVAAAVIAGTVLETALRELCDAVPINHGKLDKMNADLTKQGIYNKLQNKRITALADIRNSAAHGKSSEFTHDDVTMMIRDIESFLANHLSD